MTETVYVVQAFDRLAQEWVDLGEFESIDAAKGSPALQLNIRRHKIIKRTEEEIE